jgi:hypothetical protein
MAEGLDLYGRDLVDEAISCWRQVLELEPGHQEAGDYLEAAGFQATELDPEKALANEARQMVRGGQLVEAHDLLLAHTAARPEDLDAQALLELVRARLAAEYRERLTKEEGSPALCVAPEQLLKFNLPANAGFLVSMIDGGTSIDELVALSGLDSFEVLHLIARLADAGIVEMRQ